MSDTALALDPGGTTGWSLWAIDDDRPIQRLDYGLIHGGVDGFIEWQEQHLGLLRPSFIICENFVPDGRARYADLEMLIPLSIEGALKVSSRALGIEVVWQKNNMKAQVRDDILREHGLWITNNEARHNLAIGWTDGRDVNDSQLHALGWAKFWHLPSLEHFWSEID